MTELANLLVCFGIFFNDILRWYPFPEGRSLNDLKSIEDNILGIVNNGLTYTAILGLLLLTRRVRRQPFDRHSLLIYGYCAFILCQPLLRPDPRTEMLRA